MILIAKWLIWKSRFDNTTLSTETIISEIKIRIQTDKQYLKQEIFEDKWNGYEWLIN